MIPRILRLLSPRAAALLTTALLASGAPFHSASGQAAHPSSGNPEITQLKLTGVHRVDPSDLRLNIATDESHCKSVLLRPICVFSKSPLFYKTVTLDRAELSRDMLRVLVYYFRRGYRDTQVDTAVMRDGKRAVRVTIAVKEGPPTIVRRLAIDVDSTNVLSRKDTSRSAVLKAGQPYNLIQLDSTISLLDERLWDRGYSDAVIDTATVLDTAAKTVDLTVRINPRWRARVASVTVQGNKGVSSRTIMKSLSFKPGAVYRRSDVLASQRSLYESNLFRRAAIAVPQQDDSLKHVVIAVQEAPPHDARYSAGFNTVDFVQVAAHYTDYNWLNGAKRLTLDAAVGNLFASSLNGNGIFYDVGKTVVGGSASQYLAPTFTASADARYPWFGSPNNEAAFGVFAHRRSAPGVYVDQGFGLSATFTRTLTPRGPLSLNYRFEETNIQAGDVYFCINYGVCDAPTLAALRSRQKLSPLALSFSLDRTDNPFEPHDGYRTQFDLETATSYTASDFRYNRGSGDFAFFLPMGRKSVVGAHIRLGLVSALASTAEAVGVASDQFGSDGILHPRKRFYAGGSSSVRGYGEGQLGPRVLTIPAAKLLANDQSNPLCTAATIHKCNPNGALFRDRDFEPRPLGGNRLIEGSVEFRFPLFASLVGATFVDGAYLGQNTNPGLPSSKAAITPGFGVRYLSPVGPVRIDVGINPSSSDQLPVVTEDVATGGNGLVKLDSTRSYSPSHGSGGLNSILSRLTLHLSIGEAF
ncbi:MAG: BamA/TamA family outer membrane protein [Gemmatimonadota bacterium]|nr:BamA/TamA family outer membrane protein [Gemmatimonadota bacterium]